MYSFEYILTLEMTRNPTSIDLTLQVFTLNNLICRNISARHQELKPIWTPKALPRLVMLATTMKKETYSLRAELMIS